MKRLKRVDDEVSGLSDSALRFLFRGGGLKAFGGIVSVIVLEVIRDGMRLKQGGSRAKRGW
jgi:hypothetical protein